MPVHLELPPSHDIEDADIFLIRDVSDQCVRQITLREYLDTLQIQMPPTPIPEQTWLEKMLPAPVAAVLGVTAAAASIDSEKSTATRRRFLMPWSGK